MINRYPVWKYIVLIVVVVLGLVYAAPNFYGEDPALQISGTRDVVVGALQEDAVTEALARADIPAKGFEWQGQDFLVRLFDTDNQLAAQEVVKATLGDDYTVALNLAPATPDWLRSVGAEPMKLGLDLRGGVHFLLQVDLEQAISRREEAFINDIRNELRDERIRVNRIERQRGGGIVLDFRDQALSDEAYRFMRRTFPSLDLQQETRAGNYIIIAELNEAAMNEAREYTMSQTITTLRNRVNELGVAEAVVQGQGYDRVVVQLPGIQDTARAKDILGGTATLEFLLRDHDNDVRTVLAGGPVPTGSKVYYERDGSPVLLKRRILLTGDSIVGASAEYDENGLPAVAIRTSGAGSRLFSRITRENVGRQMAVVYIETKTATEMVNGEPVRTRDVSEEVISLATIQSALGNNFRITGIGGMEQARDLALLLRAGALPASIEIVEERTVGPSLGQENIRIGILAVQFALLLTMIAMALYYRTFGLIADAALIMNLVILFAVMSLIPGATLTLPGIAGIVLTVGMAVDANVLIFERIREELRNGSSPHASIHAGYEKAFSTIVDAQLTTLLVALILFALGTGPVKGFAVTLSIGLITSMFTAILGTRAIVNLIYGGRSVKKLSIGR